jgi:uncharacterized NAD-dependent epimerase/dehydratase family protein
MIPDDRLRGLAAETIIAAMRSVDGISKRQWWDRATSALTAAANAAGSWPQFVSRLARKLGIETFRASSGEELYDIREMVGDELPRFLRLCREEAPWIIVEARAMRAAQKKEQKRTTKEEDDQ